MVGDKCPNLRPAIGMTFFFDNTQNRYFLREGQVFWPTQDAGVAMAQTSVFSLKEIWGTDFLSVPILSEIMLTETACQKVKGNAYKIANLLGLKGFPDRPISAPEKISGLDI
jgi:hypothetical protein